MSEKKRPPYLRVVRPEDEERRADPDSAPSSATPTASESVPPSTRAGDNPPAERRDRNRARESGVESMADGERDASQEAAKARDD
jgi:hypothetical protein